MDGDVGHRRVARRGRLQLVNGYYRLTRGSYAQFGLDVPYAERVVDTVLAHGRDQRWFAAGRENACNVLDVAHPLWLAGRRSGHRAAEVRSWAEEQLTRALGRWRDGAGFGFGPAGEGSGGPGREPGLQGTEMWLAIVWLLADLVGEADRLAYRPRGVHRPEPPGSRGSRRRGSPRGAPRPPGACAYGWAARCATPWHAAPMPTPTQPSSSAEASATSVDGLRIQARSVGGAYTAPGTSCTTCPSTSRPGGSP